MSAQIIDGQALAEKIKAQVRDRIAATVQKTGRKVHLSALLAGATPAGEIYAARQQKICGEVGIDYKLSTLPADATRSQVLDAISGLNADPAVTGIMLHLPLPRHLDTTEMQYQIAPKKDVEGVNPANIGHVVYGHTLIAPCTALAAIELIKSTSAPIRSAEAVVVGASQIAGKPIALLLTQMMATVTLCHIATRDLAEHTRRADILVVAVGKPGLITADMVKPGAVVVDVGINRIVGPDGIKRTV
ncbi:MAG TPA: bifunctional 5,10-methylenetetrahydrofolate dehydrogenase/5,10-methenyltetrahydrofolate cyclohydrolase, partial [Tepidisphaeraceae bacterium]|nr:bifunctional 5,10-methylenetetrahydrofolate dehydrogenase/5,10-methenyltetrahydrofolate cyclohydrolase [Tepidisphaeraceae bacterium]